MKQMLIFQENVDKIDSSNLWLLWKLSVVRVFGCFILFHLNTVYMLSYFGTSSVCIASDFSFVWKNVFF